MLTRPSQPLPLSNRASDHLERFLAQGTSTLPREDRQTIRRSRGFGLVQRDRDFDNHLDLEAIYHHRPSEWVALGERDWGSGGVELLAIPTNSEFNDNIAAYWVPDLPFMAGDERQYRYRLITFNDRLDTQTLAQVARTRNGWDALPGQSDPPPRSQRRFRWRCAPAIWTAMATSTSSRSRSKTTASSGGPMTAPAGSVRRSRSPRH